MPDLRCGTMPGYSAHRRRGEQTCEPCRAAKTAYQQERGARQDPCAYEGCTKPRRARGYCGSHLSRIHRHGTVALPTMDDRFWPLVLMPVNYVDGCWQWTGTRQSGGYGKWSPHRGQHLLAHRWSYERIRGPIPAGLHLDHLCRITYCVNPWHLEPVTAAENTRRMHAARRAA